MMLIQNPEQTLIRNACAAHVKSLQILHIF